MRDIARKATPVLQFIAAISLALGLVLVSPVAAVASGEAPLLIEMIIGCR